MSFERCDAVCGVAGPPGCPATDKEQFCRVGCVDLIVKGSRPECQAALDAALGCLHDAMLNCTALDACATLGDAVRDCNPCYDPYSAIVRDGLHAVIVVACGCVTGTDPPGSSCIGSEGCIEECCTCSDGREFGVRMCENGRCAAKPCDRARELGAVCS
jgi:hypothetical protein